MKWFRCFFGTRKFIEKDYLVKEIQYYFFSEESFKKFNDPNDPLYELYKDRENEKNHDRGWNNALETVLKIISR